jgi:hypothetical protein
MTMTSSRIIEVPGRAVRNVSEPILEGLKLSYET